MDSQEREIDTGRFVSTKRIIGVKLTRTEARLIRHLSVEKKIKLNTLAKKFKVTIQSVWAIKVGKNWKHA